MRVVTVVGKVDSRALVYPLARALSMKGLTGIITDDGAYRRLFHGRSNIGCVNNIDINVCNHVTESDLHSFDSFGIDYENLIVVSSDYIYPDSDGLIICHGLDRSMIAVSEDEDDDDFILPVKIENSEENQALDEKSEKNKGAKKPLFGKKQLEKNDDADGDAADGSDTPAVENTESSVEKVETEHERMERLQKENPDSIQVPANIPYTEVQIAYAAAPKKDVLGISLRDGFMQYVYSCEEEKELKVFPDKSYNALIAKIASKVFDIDQKELFILLSKEESVGAPVTKKAPKK